MFIMLVVLLALLGGCNGHGMITFPPSTRHGGSLEFAGNCQTDAAACLWFSQPVCIPGKPTLPGYARSFNVHVDSGPLDWSATMPWRSPGTAPVFGSGCGIAGGNKVKLPNGGTPPDYVPQAFDGVELPARPPTTWKSGSTQEVAFAVTANHGGGYSYRLCKLGGVVDEACFQRTQLKFAGSKQWLQYNNQTYQYDKLTQLPRFEIPLVKTSEGTFPEGSEWARVPIPGCRFCDQSVCGAPLMPNMSAIFEPGSIYGPGLWPGGLPWFRQQQCAQSCSGLNFTVCPPNMVQFPEPLPGISGYTGHFDGPDISGLPYSIVDKVIVPDDLEPGEYLLSWRWDCEQSHQIWQNCADIKIVVEDDKTSSVGEDTSMEVA